jgi:hypothetical protein
VTTEGIGGAWGTPSVTELARPGGGAVVEDAGTETDGMREPGAEALMGAGAREETGTGAGVGAGVGAGEGDGAGAGSGMEETGIVGEVGALSCGAKAYCEHDKDGGGKWRRLETWDQGGKDEIDARKDARKMAT